MQALIAHIFLQELQAQITSIEPIIGHGSVNQVYAAQTNGGDFIIRLNTDPDKKIEFQKEKWCLEAVTKLHIPSPQVLAMGTYQDHHYLIQYKLPGINGSQTAPEVQSLIWKRLGEYAAAFHQIEEIEDQGVQEDEFHDDWKARLRYNLGELNEEDSLLAKGVCSAEAHQSMKELLSELSDKSFRSGLIHGDLSPRNVLVDQDKIYLLDWGTAVINIIPHHEIGAMQLNGEASEEDMQAFLEGLEISALQFESIEREIILLNLLHCLDVYRWAEGRNIARIKDYEKQVREAYEKALAY